MKHEASTEAKKEEAKPPQCYHFVPFQHTRMPQTPHNILENPLGRIEHFHCGEISVDCSAKVMMMSPGGWSIVGMNHERLPQLSVFTDPTTRSPKRG